MKIKVKEATVMQLSYLVAMIEMPHLVWGETIGIHHASNQVVVPSMKEPGCYTPFMNWTQGGTLIEREGINLYFNPDDAGAFEWHAEDRSHAWYLEGATPLIAAMRCYVASKMGDEVEIPDELLEN